MVKLDHSLVKEKEENIWLTKGKTNGKGKYLNKENISSAEKREKQGKSEGIVLL